MIIGLGQLDIEWEDKEANMVKCFNMVKDAKSKSVDLVIFPEMSLTGFSLNTSVIGEDCNDSYSIDFFRQLSLDFEIAIGFGYVEYIMQDIDCVNKATNRFVIVDKGQVLMNYAKIHPFSFGAEGDFYIGGDSLGNFTLNGFNFGGFICYDLRFPEIFQASSIKNQALIIIANWPKDRVEHFRTLLKARAIENQCYVIGINRVGLGNGLLYEGSSAIYSPNGDLVTKEVDCESLIIGEIQLDVIEQCRKDFNHRADKKPELYKTFYS